MSCISQRLLPELSNRYIRFELGRDGFRPIESQEVIMVQSKRLNGVARVSYYPRRRLSAISAVIGGAVTAVINLYMFTVLNPQEFAVIEPIGIVAGILLALGLPVYYVSEHHWFSRFATISFGFMALGTVVAALALPVATYGPGVTFLAYILGVLVLTLGAVGFGGAMLRAKAMPRAAAWLLLATLPVGLPLVLGFTTYVMGETADPWAGPLVFYGLAWVILGRSLLDRGTETSVESTETAVQ